MYTDRLEAQSIFITKIGSPDAALNMRSCSVKEPGAGEVLIDVEYSGLNFADVLARRGLYPEAPPLPFVPGYEVVGKIKRVGPNCQALEVGMRVASGMRFGGYTNLATVKAKNLVPLPETLESPPAVAMITQGTTAWYAVEEVIKLRAGDAVLVHAAAGGVGSLIVQLAKRRGAIVFGTASTEQKLNYLRSIGVDHPINYLTTDYGTYISRTLGRGARLDVVFDSLGGSHIKKALSLVGAGGRVVSFGVADVASGNRYFDMLRIFFQSGSVRPLTLLAKSQSVIGINTLRLFDYKTALLTDIAREVIGCILRREITPLIGGVFSAAEVSKAHSLLEGRASMGKLLLKW